MPEFLTEFINDLNRKSTRILEDFENKEANKLYEKVFPPFWKDYNIESCSPTQNVISVDGSNGHAPTSNGGFFFVCRALALGREKRYKDVITDFDFSNTRDQSTYISRVMELTEHTAPIKAIKDGFRGTILIDGSLFGRMAHLPLELKLANNKGFMIDYFKHLIELLKLCKEHNILLIGISKESRATFFSEFLIKEIFKNNITDVGIRNRLVSLALDNPREAIKLAKTTGNAKIIMLTEELISRKPDSLLILNNAEKSGYTHPLLLGASIRWRRSGRLISTNPNKYLETNFPTLYEDKEFLKQARQVITEMQDFPAIISFHILPSIIDTPLRVDIPAWYFGIETRLLDVGWPEAVDINIDEILKIISAGYCGLSNYNVWLSAVDDEVKLSRKDFEDLYLKKFEEIVGKKTTPRGYRRVRYP